jgi:hypothetical protein
VLTFAVLKRRYLDATTEQFGIFSGNPDTQTNTSRQLDLIRKVMAALPPARQSANHRLSWLDVISWYDQAPTAPAVGQRPPRQLPKLCRLDWGTRTAMLGRRLGFGLFWATASVLAEKIPPRPRHALKLLCSKRSTRL